jgi:hypothetical protein
MDSSILPVLENQLKQIWAGKSKRARLGCALNGADKVDLS